MNISIPTTLEERISKDGNKYLCLSIKTLDNTEVLLFPKPAEMALIKVTYNKTIKLSSSQSN